eukprot:9333594-Prorocentrum_lima.AAC.1
MTSSLVGSEMCIRDRPKSIPYPTAYACLAGRSSENIKTSGITTRWVQSCLLYTSDAADDM